MLLYHFLVEKIQSIFRICLLWILNFGTSWRNSGAMDVTKQNFVEVLPKVRQSIDEATFLTIDCEFTGLNTVSNVNAFDTIEQYYNKVRRNCREFLVIQYGISAFRYDKENNVFKQSSYNFYIFRRPVNRNIPDQRFLCQTSSIDFLISNGFDFNKLFKEGIPYLNLEEETKYEKNLEEKFKVTQNLSTSSNSNENKIAIPPTDQPFIDDVIKSIKKYLKSCTEEPLELPKCNPFLRKLIYQTTSEVFGNKINVETKQLENKDRMLYVSQVKSAEEIEKIRKLKLAEEKKILDESVGFTKVLRMVVNSGKLVVGHNVMLDMLHTIDKFLTPLPEDYKEFKECAHGLFTNILDTKFLSSSEAFKDIISSSVLGQLYDSVKQDPFTIPKIEVENGCSGYSLDDRKEHEAAFDAFITGISFLGMWSHLGREKKLTSQDTFSNLNLLKPFLNRIFLMRLQDNQYVHLGGVDPNPPRDHVFHISFPKEWKISDIQQLFSPFGNVYISWINETSAFVALYKRDQASMAYTSLSDHETCAITLFSKYQRDNNVVTSSKPNRRMSDESPLKNIKKRKISLESSSRDSISEKVLHKQQPKKHAKTFSVSDAWD